LPHGEIQTPAFMPVGTAGAVKGLTPDELRDPVRAEILLSNTFHLWVNPGHERIARLGGLHRFMGWDGPILTDSGGYQAFSFKDKAKISEQGIKFLSNHNREWYFLTPEQCVEIQEVLGVDVAMALDECPALTEDRNRVIRATERTTRWLTRCQEARTRPDQTALFGIVQGGMFPDLRAAHARELSAMDLDGYAVGGLSVGESKDQMRDMLEATTPELPTNKVRYLMGVGYPVDIVDAVIRGVDLFDCVLPSRTARFGYLFTDHGRLAIKHARFKEDPRQVDPGSTCYPLRSFSRAYLRHLHMSKDVLAPRLFTLHNLAFYQRLMSRIRHAIDQGEAALLALRDDAARWSAPYAEPPEGLGAVDA
jgi:queuine tRNA-ribosyltransferase